MATIVSRRFLGFSGRTIEVFCYASYVARGEPGARAEYGHVVKVQSDTDAWLREHGWEQRGTRGFWCCPVCLFQPQSEDAS
jgi:hypothetical protein